MMINLKKRYYLRIDRIFDMLRFTSLLLVATLSVSCGGGGGGNDCSGGKNVYTSFSYQGLSLTQIVGTPITPKVPSTPGIPASCMGSTQFTIFSGSLPPGMAIDSRTGVISGTPTTSGYYPYGVSLTLNGFIGSVATGFSVAVVDPKAYTFHGWGSNSSGIPFTDDFRLDAIGSSLVVTTAGFYSKTMDTFTSPDGATWTKSSATGPTPYVKHFSSTSDGTAVYLSGGVMDSGVYTNDVWKFDGSTWSQITSAAAFPVRQDHAMVKLGTTLYVIGGKGVTGYLGDVWKSTNDGITWTLASTPFSPRALACAISFNNKLVVIGGQSATANLSEVWESSDGINWTPDVIPANSPFVGSTTENQQCTTMNGRVYFIGETTTVSSADLVHWQYEPSIFIQDAAPGAVSVNNRIYAIGGMGTSERSVNYTTP